MFEIKEIEDEKFDEFYERAMGELNKFFEKNWILDKPIAVFIPNKETYDSVRGRKTDDWERAFACGNSIYLLDPKAYKKDASCHVYSDENFFMLMKHELTHCFWNLFTSKYRPIWLSEGLAIYLAGQYQMRDRPKEFSNFLDFYDELDRYTYDEAGFVVEILVEKFGKEKMLDLLGKLDSVECEDGFYNLFERIYGFRIGYEKMNELLGENGPQISRIDADGGEE